MDRGRRALCISALCKAVRSTWRSVCTLSLIPDHCTRWVLSWLVAAQVETTFTSRSLLPAYYWLGLERAGNLYYWVDGTRVNNGNVSNTNPCEHAW
jgi:hypothetical protein